VDDLRITSIMELLKLKCYLYTSPLSLSFFQLKLLS